MFAKERFPAWIGQPARITGLGPKLAAGNYAMQLVTGNSSTSHPYIASIQAPWIRPGIVVHDPNETIDGLLAEFALGLRARGFKVRGFVQRNNSGCTGDGQGCRPTIEYFDLATSSSLSLPRGALDVYLRNAMKESADLLVISRFFACVEATSAPDILIGGEGEAGIPVLTSVAGQCLHKMHRLAQPSGALVLPRLEALWAWWGPERLYRDIALGVAEDDVLRIACGTRWIMVEGRNGTGLAPLLRPPRDLAPLLAGYARRSLRELARLCESWNQGEAALGLAAINANYNRTELDARPGNGVKAFRHAPEPIVVIGGFPGLGDILPGSKVIDAAPRSGEFPLSAIDTLIPESGTVVIGSRSLAERLLPRVLRLAQNRPVAMIGASTPLTARLFDYGLNSLGGLVVTDPAGLAVAVRSGAQAREFGRFGRYVHIRRDPDAVPLARNSAVTVMEPA